MPAFDQARGPAFVRAETFNALPYSGFTFESYMVRPAPLSGYLDEGDIVDLGNRTFQVFYLPGHSPDSIALYEKRAASFSVGIPYMMATSLILFIIQTGKITGKACEG